MPCVAITIQYSCNVDVVTCREMCVRFADLERKLGEIDRARAVYAHGSQMADPRVSQKVLQLSLTHV